MRCITLRTLFLLILFAAPLSAQRPDTVALIDSLESILKASADDERAAAELGVLLERAIPSSSHPRTNTRSSITRASPSRGSCTTGRSVAGRQ